jgi:hypothetical protein
MHATDTSPENVKLFSRKSIALATFLGGIGAGFMLIGLNFRNTGSPRLATVTISGGLILMVIYLFLIFILPEDDLNKFVFMVLPLALTVLMYYVSDQLQGNMLIHHAENGYPFYSRWIAAGIGGVFMMVVFGSAYIYSSVEVDKAVDQYNRLSDEVNEYDAIALEAYHYLDMGDSVGARKYIVQTAFPALDKMENLINEMLQVEYISDDEQLELERYKEYLYWRRQAFHYITQGIEEGCNHYQLQIHEAHLKIDSLFGEME